MVRDWREEWPRYAEQKDFDEKYNSFWKELVETDGVLDLEKIKRELYDFSFLMSQVPKVYMHVTGGKMSKTTYFAEDVINLADEETARQIEIAFQDERECNEDEPIRESEREDY